MGLAVAYGIAKRSGAVLRVNGPIGGGAEIEICFPEQPPSDIKWVLENP
jgi:signal transduction histidine kinase